MAKHQAALFFPLLLLEGLNLHCRAPTCAGPRRSSRTFANATASTTSNADSCAPTGTS